MKVDWKQFAQRRNLNIKAFRNMSYESYCKWCEIRGVNPISRDTFSNVKITVNKKENLIENLDLEIVTGSKIYFDESKLKKLKKADIQTKCREHSIEYENSDTKKVLIDKLLKLNN